MKKCLPITAKLNRMQKPYNGSSGPNVSPDGDMISSPAKQTVTTTRKEIKAARKAYRSGDITNQQKKDIIAEEKAMKKDSKAAKKSPAKMCGCKNKKY